MNQNNQMRELCPSCRNADIYACTCPFKTARNHTPDTGKMVRLTDDEVAQVLGDDIDGVYLQDFHKVMDAMIAKNGGRV